MQTTPQHKTNTAALWRGDLSARAMPGRVRPCTIANIHIIAPRSDARSHASQREKLSGQWLSFPALNLQNNIYLSGDGRFERLESATVLWWIRV